MAKRHALRHGDWESIFGRLQELVLANSGEDEFEEIFKLLLAKLYDETCNTETRRFSLYENSSITADKINSLLTESLGRWAGIFDRQPKSRLRDDHLAVCVETLQDIELLDSSLVVLDGLFEYLVGQAAKGNKGQYFTPRHVIECCIRIIDPQPGETIIDPACGSGGFLMHALNHVRSHQPKQKLIDYPGNNIWGCDFDKRAHWIAKVLMILANAPQANIYRLNSLLTPEANRSFVDLSISADDPRLTIEDLTRSKYSGFKGFDIVLANPPFAGEIRERQILDTYQLGKDKDRIERDVLFLERCIQLLRPGGRMAIVLPHNKFGSLPYRGVREWLIKQVRIVSVLGLGRNTFLPHTHQKTSILFAVKRLKPLSKHDFPSEDILFLISEKEGKDTKGRIIEKPDTQSDDPIWERMDHDLDEVVKVFQQYAVTSDLNWGEHHVTALAS
jgi:type I restriction enzyme M protein